ncbi:hypothetical protein AB1K89_00920 [Sporosarcina sp. 179-K 8C2 HS]|uniref:hypothetical protein n=1 Tax=Sporosarcina sp. 179-K 8C2 HS TaxID=3142387 RepID=UPI00399F7A23
MDNNNEIFYEVLKMDWHNVEQVKNLVDIIPSSNEAFAADTFYLLLYKELHNDEQKYFPKISSPKNLISIILKHKDTLTCLTNEINLLLKNFNPSKEDYQQYMSIRKVVEKELRNIEVELLHPEQKRIYHSYVNLKSNSIREYFYVNLSLILYSGEKIYLCTHCNGNIYAPTKSQIAIFNRIGTILHDECREARKRAKNLELHHNKKRK